MTDPRIAAVLAVLAPTGDPIFEWPHEETPTADQMRDLAGDIVAAIDGARTGTTCMTCHGRGVM